MQKIADNSKREMLYVFVFVTSCYFHCVEFSEMKKPLIQMKQRVFSFSSFLLFNSDANNAAFIHFFLLYCEYHEIDEKLD